MLNFIISTIAFFVAIVILNRYLDKQGIENSRFRKIVILVAATIISIAVGWVVDDLDGDAELHKNDPFLSATIRSVDPVGIAKLLAGIHCVVY